MNVIFIRRIGEKRQLMFKISVCINFVYAHNVNFILCSSIVNIYLIILIFIHYNNALSLAQATKLNGGGSTQIVI